MSNLKDFVRLRQVGKGAFGVAWLVEARDGGRRFVVKDLGQKEMSEKERLEARKEVMFLSKMNHPNIVSYYNSFEESGRVHILMEYCENGDLGARIKAQTGILFKEDQILDYFIQICHAIKHIHDNKILHRDIKPQNIFLTKSNVVKLGDFGIAKLMNSTTAFTSTTVGTPFYFSPELCSRRMYNNKSDIWSLGCVLYELCTLNYAFSAQEMAILALRIKNVSYKPISVNYSSGLRFLISSIFQRDPRERPNINEILKKPFISRIVDRSWAQNPPRLLAIKEVNQRRASPVIVGKIDSGLNNRKVLNKENLIANSPYLPPSKKPMIKRQENIKPNALVIKKNELSKRRRAEIIISDRENAWKNILSTSDESKEDIVQIVENVPKEKVLGIYDHYHVDLDRLKQQQELRDMEGKQLMHRFHKISDDDISEGVYRKIDPVKNNIQLGVNAADRDKLVQEYWDNKQKAYQNRNRNGAGVALALCGARKIEIKNVPAQMPHNHDEEIADRLNKIRQQNAEEKRNQNIGNFNLDFDKDNGVILNKENARLALEDLHKKMKLKSEELHQKLALKRLEKEKENEAENPRKEEQQVKPSKDAHNRINNVILFPKRVDPYVPTPRIKIEENKLPDPRMTNILDQINDRKQPQEANVDNPRKDQQIVRSSDDTEGRPNNVTLFPKRVETFIVTPKEDIEDVKVQDPGMTNLLEQIKNVKPSGDKDNIAWKDHKDIKMPSLSVVLNKLREDSNTPRPCTAPAAEKSEIKKIKTDILKRINKNQCLLDSVDVENHRKSWALDFDDNLIKKDENAHSLDDTLTDTNTMANVSVLTNYEECTPMQKWQTDLKLLPNIAIDRKPSKSVWSQNKEFPFNLIIKDGDCSIENDDMEMSSIMADGTTVKLENKQSIAESKIVTESKDTTESEDTTESKDTTESENLSESKDTTELQIVTKSKDITESKIITNTKEIIRDMPEDIEDLLSDILEVSEKSNFEPLVYLTKTEAWEKISLDKKDKDYEFKKENERLHSTSSSEDDTNKVSAYMRKILEIKESNDSSDEDVTKYNGVEDNMELFDFSLQVSDAHSMPDLLQIKNVSVKRTQSEGNLDRIINEDESDNDEDFSDEKTEDENIFLKIEMIRDKLEKGIGLDPLIDAMEFVRESQDLDGDHIADRLRKMLNDDEDAVNDIFHLVVLEEQYNNMD